MGNHALGASGMPPPQVSDRPELIREKAVEAPLAHLGSSEIADRIFQTAIYVCGASLLVLVTLIVYELVAKSQLSWHAFGWHFFFRSEWDPVNEQFGALPFIFGTVVSSILALILAVPLAIGVAV